MLADGTGVYMFLHECAGWFFGVCMLAGSILVCWFALMMMIWAGKGTWWMLRGKSDPNKVQVYMTKSDP